ncbi:MAG: hypothetical protein J5803_03445, partial [Desulfovibrio sp.]|nr:hypothetical protein [Desulfovibrio sp.]
MPLDLEKVFYDLHFDRKTWVTLGQERQKALFCAFRSTNTERKEWARTCLVEALRIDPHTVFLAMPPSVKKQMAEDYLERAGIEGLARLTPKALGFGKDARLLRQKGIMKAVAIAPRKTDIVRFLTRDEFSDAFVQNLLCSLFSKQNEGCASIVDFIPKETLCANAKLFWTLVKKEKDILVHMDREVLDHYADDIVADPSLFSLFSQPEQEELRKRALAKASQIPL